MSFKGLSGQKELRQLLTGMLSQGKLSHAIMLTGPSGIGKFSWGKALTLAILCLNNRNGEACLECVSCRQFSSGNHPEFFLIEPDGRNIKIEQVRSLRTYFSLRGDKKVCLIKHAETMTAEASSSLLKILEEPPAGLYFILMAENTGLLFDTILSRCQHYKLQPLTRDEILNLLVNKKNMSADKAFLLARICKGIPGHALALAEDEEFTKRFEEANALASSLVYGYDSTYHLLLKASSLADRDDLLPFLNLLCIYYRDCLVKYLCCNEELLMNPKIPLVQGVPEPVSRMVEVIRLINSTINDLTATNANRLLLLEKMLIMIQRRFTKCPG